MEKRLHVAKFLPAVYVTAFSWIHVHCKKGDFTSGVPVGVGDFKSGVGLIINARKHQY